jgi:hypothetical protein
MAAVCTVVVRWSDGQSAQILALRDELTDREFDDPGPWWPEQPGVVGGRDRVAGGTWCATSVATGATALVLNRPARRQAAAGAPSRGLLPLLAVEHGEHWAKHVALDGMASFLLVLATPHGLATWDFDGEGLTPNEHPAGTHMITSGGPEDRKADRHLPAFAAAEFPDGWRRLVQVSAPSEDPESLVVRRQVSDPELGTFVFATVFGELIEAAPGRLRLEYSRRPWTAQPWQRAAFG